MPNPLRISEQFAILDNEGFARYPILKMMSDGRGRYELGDGHSGGKKHHVETIEEFLDSVVNKRLPFTASRTDGSMRSGISLRTKKVVKDYWFDPLVRFSMVSGARKAQKQCRCWAKTPGI